MLGFFVLFLAKIRVKTERRALYVNLAFSNSCTTFRLISEKVKANNFSQTYYLESCLDFAYLSHYGFHFPIREGTIITKNLNSFGVL